MLNTITLLDHSKHPMGTPDGHRRLTSTVTGSFRELYPEPGLVISIPLMKPFLLSRITLASACTPPGSLGGLMVTNGGVL